MRRAVAILTALAVAVALVAVAAGCGGSSSASSPLDDAVGYMPRNSLAIVAIKTNPGDKQFKNVSALLDKFPFGAQIKARIKQGITAQGGRLDYERQVKPLLGNDLVVGIPPGGVRGTSGNAFVLAWKTKGGDAKKLFSQNSKQVGSEEGAALYRNADGSVGAIKGDVLIAAKTRPLLDAALRARNSSGRMTESDFNGAFAGLRTDGLVRVEGDLQKILASSPGSAQARRVPWVAGLRTFAATTATDPDGISIDFRVKTQGVSAGQLPLATGAAPAPVVTRPGEIGSGLRNPSQIMRFAEQVAGLTNPGSLLARNRVSKQLGVDIDRDVIAQTGGDSASSFSLDGGYALRADLKDPAAFRTTLATIMKNLPKAQRAQGKPASTVKHGPGYFVVIKPGGKPQVVGVFGRELVVASDVGRAQEFGLQSARAVPGTKGALSFSADPRSLITSALKRRGNPAAALLIGPAIAQHLQALAGSVESEPDGLRGTIKLTVR